MVASKRAFLVKIADVMPSSMKAQVLPGTVCPTLVCYFEDIAFKVIIIPEQEVKFLADLPDPTPSQSKLLSNLKLTYSTSLLHHGMIHKVHTQHPASRAVTRLLQRWVSSQMLSGLVNLEVLELLVAKVRASTTNTA